MAFELPDFWTTFGIGLALLSLVPGMTSVPSATHIEFKISRICALAAATLFLFKVALWGSDLTAARVGLIAPLGAIIAVAAAYTLHWINKKEEAATAIVRDTPEKAKAEIHPENKSEMVRSQLALEATNRSVIDATGGQFPSDMPFPFAKADNDSFINMPGVKVTKNSDGSMSVSSAPVTQQFPPPTGEYANLSKQELRAEIVKASSELRSFDAERTESFRLLSSKYSDNDFSKNPRPDKFAQESKDISGQLQPKTDRLAKLAQSLASECMARIGVLDGSTLSMSARSGAGGVLHAKFAGPHPALEAAEFLDELSRRLD